MGQEPVLEPPSAITAELDAGKPRGPAAVKLLVEAMPHLTGGIATLRQYGEARGCASQDIAAADRAVVGSFTLDAASPSSSRPSSTKNATAAARSSTTTPT
jgi:hypothetical protein